MMRNGQKAVKDSDRRGERIERASEGRLRITLADFWAWVHDVLPVAGPVHLQNVVGETHQGPFGPYLVDAPQQKLPESARLLDLAEHRFYNRLAAAYAALPALVFSLRRMRSTRVAPSGSGPRGQGSLYSSCFCRSVATYPSMRRSGFSSESSASRFFSEQ